MVDYDDLEMALEFSSSGEAFGSEAYIDEHSGEIYYISDASDEEYPEDIYENSQYILIPTKRDLGLGKPLALDFATEFTPNHIEMVYEIFHSKGAFHRFKAFLEDRGLLEKWYKYEQVETKNKLVEWCSEVGLKIT